MAAGACSSLWDSRVMLGASWNQSRVDMLEETIFAYMQENVALVNIYMREPYCTTILQEINYTV